MALGIVALAAIIAHQTSEIPASAIYAKVGPAIFPYVIAFGLGLLGLMLLFAALNGSWPEGGEDDNLQPDRKALVWLLSGLILNVALIDWIGFMLASTLLFVFTARAFGSRNWLRNGGIGLAVALFAWAAFEKLLGIQVSAGLFETML